MREYLTYFFEKFDYSKDAGEAITRAYSRIESSEDAKDIFKKLLTIYENDMNCDFKGLLNDMSELSQKVDVHEYTGHLLLVICMSKKLKEYYWQAGIAEDIWFTGMCDLKWKMIECKCVYDICGTFVGVWFKRFYNLSRFAIGKLQFEVVPFQRNYEKDGLVLTPESTVINVHIPRTGTKLDRESQKKSYSDAAVFFKERYQLDTVVFVCDSWLLFPRNKEVLSPKSNLYSFISDYDVIEQKEYDNYNQVWRLFDKKYEGDVDLLPQDSSFRRAYADWIRKGIKTGCGYGVYIWK